MTHGHKNIRFQVAPGFIESDMTAELPANIIEGVKTTIPAGRFGKPEEVAGLVKYLALDGKRFAKLLHYCSLASCEHYLRLPPFR